jgi:hypothetical protein
MAVREYASPITDDKPISRWMSSTDMFHSRYGLKTGLEWCHAEVERNERLGGSPWIVGVSRGMCRVERV